MTSQLPQADPTTVSPLTQEHIPSWRRLINEALAENKKVAIVIGLSAGKDSTAVGLLFKNVYPELLESVHFVFADTGSELPETYEYLAKLETFFGRKITHLMSKLGPLEDIIKIKFNGFLPSPRSRYCTRMSKIVPFRDYMDGLAATHDVVFNLVGIRADEPTRTGYVPCGQYALKVFTVMPLADEGMDLAAVFKLVGDEIGLPSYYEWRTRSGCTYCVQGDVEVFVRNHGWVRFDQYDGKGEVLQYDPAKETVSFVVPSKLHKLSYSGEMIHVRSRLVDLITTPDHRWIQKNKRKLAGPWEFSTAEELPLQFFTPVSGRLENNDGREFNEDLIRLAVAIQADGWISGRRAYLSFSKQRKIDRLLDLADRANVELRALKPGPTAKARLSVDLGYWNEHSYFDIQNKEWTQDVLGLSSRCREVLLDELKYWDSQNVTKEGSYTYLTTSLNNAEVIQAAAHVTGYIGSRFSRSNGVKKSGEEHKPVHAVNIQTSKNYTMVSERNHHGRVLFEGNVYCVTVPTSAFLIRSKGKVLATGNCYFQRRVEWVGLLEKHPDLFEHAKSFEKAGYTWIKDYPLTKIEENKEAIKARYVKRLQNAQDKSKTLSLTDQSILAKSLAEKAMAEEDEEDLGSCSTCR